jgi:heme A synthase
MLPKIDNGKGALVVNLHGSLFIAVALYLLICAIWGFVLAVLRRPIGPSFRGSLRIAEGLILAQVVVGAIVFLSGAPRPPSPLHYLYGLVIVLALPAAETLAPQWWKGRHQTLVVAVGCLFAFGLSVRAAMTGM